MTYSQSMYVATANLNQSPDKLASTQIVDHAWSCGLYYKVI